VGTKDIDRFLAGKGLNRVLSRSHPEIPRKLLWIREFTFGEQSGFTRPSLLADDFQAKHLWPEEGCTHVDSE
jgi:hypothetical protein